jgi:hypothetical protein
MRTVLPTADFAKLVASIDAATPVLSLNLQRFKKEADYPSGSSFNACSGREAYLRYMELTEPRVAAVGGKVEWISDVLARLAGFAEEPAWDACVAVRYPSFKAFTQMRDIAPEHAGAPVHRLAALDDSRTFLLRA